MNPGNVVRDIFIISLCILSLVYPSGAQTTVLTNDNFSIKKIVIPVEGTPYDLEKNLYDYDSWYGTNPYIILFPDSDNSYEIVWLDKKSNTIKLISLDDKDKKVKELNLQYVVNYGRLLGYTKIPEKEYHVIAYSNRNFDLNDFNIAAFDKDGKEIFNTYIFGKNPEKAKDEREGAGDSGTGRLVYNKETKHLGFYVSLKKKWNDGIKHQGSYIGFLSSDGKILKNNRNEDLGKKWFVSHDFGQRMITYGKYYYLLSHGDGYPRALQISKWQDTIIKRKYSWLEENIWKKEYYSIPGGIGHNRTDTELGDLINVNDSIFATVFCTTRGSIKRNLMFTKIKEVQKGPYSVKIDYETLQLTNYSDFNAYVPKIAKLKNNNLLVMWQKHDAHNNFLQTHISEIDISGNIISCFDLNKDIKLQPVCDLVNLPNGYIIWALGDAVNKKIIVYKLRYKH